MKSWEERQKLQKIVDDAFREYDKVVSDFMEFDGDRRGIASHLYYMRDKVADAILARGVDYDRYEDE